MYSRLNPDQIIVYHDFTIVSRSVFKINSNNNTTYSTQMEFIIYTGSLISSETRLFSQLYELTKYFSNMCYICYSHYYQAINTRNLSHVEFNLLYLENHLVMKLDQMVI